MLNNKDYTGELTCVISCSNLSKSTKWYKDNLGFTLLYQVDEIAWAEFKTPLAGITIGLQEVDDFLPQDSILTFSTPDIETTLAKLDSQYVKHDEIRTIEGLVKLMKVYDPDLNVLQFAQSIGE